MAPATLPSVARASFAMASNRGFQSGHSSKCALVRPRHATASLYPRTFPSLSVASMYPLGQTPSVVAQRSTFQTLIPSAVRPRRNSARCVVSIRTPPSAPAAAALRAGPRVAAPLLDKALGLEIAPRRVERVSGPHVARAGVARIRSALMDGGRHGAPRRGRVSESGNGSGGT